MAATEVSTDLVKALAETKDARLNYLWTAVSIAKEAGNVSATELFSYRFVVGMKKLAVSMFRRS